MRRTVRRGRGERVCREAIIQVALVEIRARRGPLRGHCNMTSETELGQVGGRRRARISRGLWVRVRVRVAGSGYDCVRRGGARQRAARGADVPAAGAA